MRRVWCWLSVWIVALATAPGAAQQPAERVEIAYANARIETDYVAFYENNTLRLEGNVVVRAERLGRNDAFLYLTAERVTVIFGQDDEGDPALSKAYASGGVHVEVTTVDEVIGRTQHVAADADRAEYIGPNDVIHLLTTGDEPIVADYTLKTAAEPGVEGSEPREYHARVTARRRWDIFLREAPPDILGPEEGSPLEPEGQP